MALADATADLEPIHLGEHHVEHHEIDAARVHSRDRRGAVADGGDGEPLALERVLEHLADARFVVDDKDVLAHVRLARVRAVFRRMEAPPAAEEPARVLLRHGEIEIDIERHEVRFAGRVVSLTPTELGVLGALIERPGVVLSLSLIHISEPTRPY